MELPTLLVLKSGCVMVAILLVVVDGAVGCGQGFGGAMGLAPGKPGG